ncbi:hypothetical protein B0O99DRAFT_611649 [Bisporella sp. PMI_857]|nr:hypothetical protein B0O99DRAFT_611649 [Bisporella sp. PMI_857]
MPPSLRKSCHACTAAKRKCQPQLPKCARCLKNGIPCAYDLEPLAQVSLSPEEQPITTPLSEGRLASTEIPAHANYAVFNDVTAAHRAAAEALQQHNQGLPAPELRMVPDEAMLLWFVSELAQMLDRIQQGQSSPFVHARLYLEQADSAAHMQDIMDLHRRIIAGSSSIVRPSRNAHLRLLRDLDIKIFPLKDVLIYIHELALLLIIYSVNNLPSEFKAEIQQYVELLVSWIEHLWAAVQDQPANSEGVSQWHGWIMAESIRRTIIAAHFIKGAISVMRSGFLIYIHFLEALPFDPRRGLWEAMSEDAWNTTVRDHGGEPEVLLSFREFVEDYGDHSSINQEGMFQKMLLVAFNGQKVLQILAESNGKKMNP